MRHSSPCVEEARVEAEKGRSQNSTLTKFNQLREGYSSITVQRTVQETKQSTTRSTWSMNSNENQSPVAIEKAGSKTSIPSTGSYSQTK
jgi:hypothetical protein